VRFDHALKLDRALQHLKDLDGASSRWLDEHSCSVRNEYDPDAGFGKDRLPMPHSLQPSKGAGLGGAVTFAGQVALDPAPDFGQRVFTVYATLSEQPPRDPISLLIGETLHNMRSALDNLAFSLAVRFKGEPLPKKIADRSEFPIFGDENGDGFDNFHRCTKKGEPAPGSGLAKIEGWDPRTHAIIEGLQPYKRGDDYRSDPLWALHELDRINKHRLLHTCAAVPTATRWDMMNFVNVRQMGPGIVEIFGVPIETDTPIIRIWGLHPIAPERQMDVDIRPALRVAFGLQTPVVPGEPVVETLGNLLAYIRTTALPPLVKFLA
jgi:hypothetical protein